MDADIARLGIEVDATQAVAATRALDDLARASGAAEQAAQRLSRSRRELAEPPLATDRLRASAPAAGDLAADQETAAEGARHLGRAMASAFDQAIFRGRDLQDILGGLARDFERLALRTAVRGAFDGILSGGAGVVGGLGAALARLLPFAEGGVMTPQGAPPLQRYSAGGIADSPQLALFGEGRQPEAFVPLPDGRSIPVTVKGGAERPLTVINHITVNTPDADGFRRSESQIGAEIAARLQRHLRRNG